MWQARHVAGLLSAAEPSLEVTFVPVTTRADVRLDVPIADLGGKGVFAKEVQVAVLDGRADLAVHSAKDLTAVTVDGLRLAAVPERGDPRDALVGARLEDLPRGAVVGTGSARRRVQLAAIRPDLDIRGIRGNIATRLSLLDSMDAVVVAHAALERLELSDRAAQVFEVDEMVPQVAQGALAIECRAEDSATAGILAAVEHAPSRLRVDAERAFLARLGGSCDLPAGAHAEFTSEGTVRLLGTLSPDAAGPAVRRSVESAAVPSQLAAAAENLADDLLAATRDASVPSPEPPDG